jgi:hypothetical protein
MAGVEIGHSYRPGSDFDSGGATKGCNRAAKIEKEGPC